MLTKHALAHFLVRPSLLRKLIDSFVPIPPGLYIFLWHEITDKPSQFMQETQMYTTTHEFAHQLEFIKTQFYIISPAEIANSNFLNLDPNKRFALLSFDDAWKGIFHCTYSFLKPRNIKPVIFTNFGAIKGRVDFCAFQKYMFGTLHDLVHNYESIIEEFFRSKDSLRINPTFQGYQGELLDSKELETLDSSNSAFISNHLSHHFDCGKISFDMFVELFNENRNALKSYRNFLNWFAFPFGVPALNSSRDKVEYLQREGISYFWANSTINLTKGEKLPTSYGRIGIQRETQAEFWLKVRRGNRCINVNEGLSCG